MTGAANKTKIVYVVVSAAQFGDALNVVNLLADDRAHTPVTELADPLIARPDELAGGVGKLCGTVSWVLVIPAH